MVKITATLPAKSVDAVLANLDRVGVTGFTVIEGKSPYPVAEGWTGGINASPGDDIFETVAQDEAAADIVDMIRRAANLEEGTSRIVVSPVSDAIRIRTEERGDSAIR